MSKSKSREPAPRRRATKSSPGPRPADRGDFGRAARAFQDGLARICRLYGVSPLLGRLYAVLYLATEPVSLEELCRRVGAAKSTVSVALRKLVATRVVRRAPPRGDRRDFYEAVTDPWAIFADWGRMFVEPELAMWRETGDALDRALGAAADAPPPDDRDEIGARLARMREFLVVMEQVLGQVDGTRPAPTPARAIAIQVDDGEGP